MSRKAKKHYTEDFKNQAVRLSSDLGQTKAARQLGISEGSLVNWKKSHQGKEKLSEAEQIKVDREELSKLRKETAEQKQVILILKKAAAFFSNDQLK